MARATSTREPIALRSIVEHDGYRWTVVGRHEAEGLHGRGPSVTLQLERDDKEETTTPYGKPQRYRTIKRRVQAAESRCRLLGLQTTMFD